MADMPLRNPALRVEAVGFRDWEAGRVGVLVTPWCVNLVILPTVTNPAGARGADVRQSWRFPSGVYEFMGGSEPECGPFQFCSLYSPPGEFCSQDQARAVSISIMEQLFQAAPPMSRRALLAPSAMRDTACTK